MMTLKQNFLRGSYPPLITPCRDEAAYARRTLSTQELAELQSCGEFTDLLAAGPAPADVVAATLELIGEQDMSRVRPQTWPAGTVVGGPVILVGLLKVGS